MKSTYSLFIIVLIFCFFVKTESFCYDIALGRKNPSYDHAVTYTFSGGRFGDNLLAYFHAKWISYKYGIPLLYKPFQYSDQLHMHFDEKHYSDFEAQKYIRGVRIQNDFDIQKALTTTSLLVLPYFSESKWEREHSLYYGRAWSYISVDWQDPGFRRVLQQAVMPQFENTKIQVPEGRLSVACHIRRGGGFDTEHTFRNMALKFPQDNFFISEIQSLLKQFPGRKLYVYLFTDDKEPIKIKEKYEKIFSTEPVLFDCCRGQNSPNLNVLEDFFAMIQFDCLIHGESNFSLCASKLADYLYESQATAFHWEGNSLIIDQVLRKIKKNEY